MARVAVIGGGLTGLGCALHLAEHGVEVHLFEAAPVLGGRTRSFYDQVAQTWVDNGPHLLLGAYRHARSFFARHGVDDIAWQPRLSLPLWDGERGHFSLSPGRGLPLALSLAWAASRLPGHGATTMLAMLRLGAGMRRPTPDAVSTADWFQSMRIPLPLQRDLLIPLCLGAMNEPAASAPAASFARVLRQAFADHDSARLGWFTRPFAQALLAPLEQALRRHGVHIHLSSRISALHRHDHHPSLTLRSGETRRFDHIVLTLPAYGRDRLLGHTDAPTPTRPITNVHMWFDEELRLPHPFIGGIGTLGHWFFDIDRQMPGHGGRYRHFCAVISADAPTSSQHWVEPLCNELTRMLGRDTGLRPVHVRMVHERRATTLVRPSEARIALPASIVDAGEQPRIGELPATIETAIGRGLYAADRILDRGG